MDIKIISSTINYIDALYLAGRGCYGLEYLSNESMKEKRVFIKKIIENQHESVLEPGHISILINGCSRSFMAQITRHRLVSFSIKSQHYVEHDNFKYKDLESQDSTVRKIYNDLMERINNDYKRLVCVFRVPIHVAREILPNACLTNVFMTANFREWRYIIKLRETEKNTYEMIRFSRIIKARFRELVPEVFSDL